ncbi:divergent polysaccharide deacetylase family protein [Clostridium formicaceticum]|uniref:Divergent polysaccharide deacetylase n=1 Tax=Clostridium formicaceticum TaxID=1497 RepID=A0AAC9WI09_9CLOT|nr:divergent polysaccharide deacetylase family protein [Clostridium formicaceticum]AOY75064.1 hypothetical protein BJL90_03615 [Clostridium formicaceticum]ARE89488.1 Divergent polysaccharide deacetylase [Clostridium formicaceticum]
MKNKIFFIVINKKRILCSLILFIILFLIMIGVRIQIKKNTKVWNYHETIVEKLGYRENREVKAKIAIIIDDFGNAGNGTKEMVDIQATLTCAVIPFLPYTTEDAELAHSKGHEIIIHLPMEPHIGSPKWLGEKGITINLSTEQIKSIMREAIENVSYAVGINNHMGSKATEDKRIMAAIIDVLKENNMYIVDSKTSMNSVIAEIAKEYEVPVLERAVFLDNEKNVEAIKRQLVLLGELALEKGYAIGIGHVGPEGGVITAKAIQEMIPVFEKKGIEIVPISDLIK